MIVIPRHLFFRRDCLFVLGSEHVKSVASGCHVIFCLDKLKQSRPHPTCFCGIRGRHGMKESLILKDNRLECRISYHGLEVV